MEYIRTAESRADDSETAQAEEEKCGSSRD